MITLEQAKEALRVTDDIDDDSIVQAISAVSALAISYTNDPLLMTNADSQVYQAVIAGVRAVYDRTHDNPLDVMVPFLISHRVWAF